jgi:hypothetical protein
MAFSNDVLCIGTNARHCQHHGADGGAAPQLPSSLTIGLAPTCAAKMGAVLTWGRAVTQTHL